MRPSTLRRLRVEAGEAGEDDLGEDRGGGGGVQGGEVICVPSSTNTTTLR